MVFSSLLFAHSHTLQHDLVAELQNALDYLWEASRYEVMGEVGKLLLPFYEEERDYQVMAKGDSPRLPPLLPTYTFVIICCQW